MKNKTVQCYLIATVIALPLGSWADYLGTPWFVSVPCYFIMGIVIGIVWR